MKLVDVIRRPLITEKTTVIREDGRTLVFQVANDANKIDIKRAVEQLLGSKVESVSVAYSVEDALTIAQKLCDGYLTSDGTGRKLFVIGGGEIYALALRHATHLDLTEIDADFEGDARFPAYDRGDWEEVARESAREGDLGYAFVTYRRRPPKRNPNEIPARGYQGP